MLKVFFLRKSEKMIWNIFCLVRQAVRQTSDHVHHLPAEQVGPTGVQPVRKVHDQVEAQRNIKKGENKFCDDSTAIYSLP